MRPGAVDAGVGMARKGASRPAADAAGQPCAPPRIAFVLLGAFYTSSSTRSLHSFAEHVVKPLGGNPGSAAFVSLYLMQRRGSRDPPGADAVAEVRASLSEFPVQLGGVSVETFDVTEQHFSQPPVHCLWGCGKRGQGARGRDREYCKFIGDRVTHWWGRMALAWDLLLAFEQAQHVTFESVLLTRPDLMHTASVFNPCSYDTSAFWYSANSPPDSIWLFNRRVAHSVMLTIRNVIDDSNSTASSSASPVCRKQKWLPSTYLYSWLPLCFWAREYAASGLRVRLFDGLHASVEVKAGSTVWDVNAGRDRRRKPVNYTMHTVRPGVHCGWF
jgi:hypothetical protein